MTKQTKKKSMGTGMILLLVLVAAAMAGVMLWVLVPRDEPAAPAKPRQTTAAAAPVTTAPETTAEQPQQSRFPIELGDGLCITGIREFAGIYMEDGSDDAVQGLLSLVLENQSGQALQYARITLDYGGTEAVFEVTNLPADGQIVLLEKTRMAYREDMPQGAYAENAAWLETFPMYPEIFEITTADNVINIHNISDADITGDIFVYYKNVGGGVYYGGITYRVRIEGGLKAGEIRQLMTSHYYEDASEILMVTYGS